MHVYDVVIYFYLPGKCIKKNQFYLASFSDRCTCMFAFIKYDKSQLKILISNV